MGNNGCGKKIAITGGKGFQMTFENGWTVSVQWGRGNYCGNRYDETEHRSREYYGDDCAEVWAWRGNEQDEDVTGYLSPDEVAAYIVEVAAR